MEFMDADAAPSASEHSDEEEDDTEDPALVVVVEQGEAGEAGEAGEEGEEEGEEGEEEGEPGEAPSAEPSPKATPRQEGPAAPPTPETAIRPPQPPQPVVEEVVPAETDDPMEKIFTQWVKLDIKPWGRRLDNAKLVVALGRGQTRISQAELKSWGLNIEELLEDVCFIGADNGYFELVSDVGSFVCPRCRLVLLSVTHDGLVVPTQSAKPSKYRRRCPCSTGKPIRLDLHAEGNQGRTPLELLRERIDALDVYGSLDPSEFGAERSSPTRRGAQDEGQDTTGFALDASSSGPLGGVRSVPSQGHRKTSSSSRGGFRNSWLASLPPSSSTPRSLIRSATTEALYRRFEVERANRLNGDDERESQKERRDFEKERAEQHKNHGAAIIDAERQQRRRANEARQNVEDVRREGGAALQQSLVSGFEELKQQRHSKLERQKVRVQDTRSMQLRAKQNVMSVKEANLEQGKEGRIQVFEAKAKKDQTREEVFHEKWELASRVREETSLLVTSEARAIWLEENAQAGEMLKAAREERREQRENERLDYLSEAFNFREDVRMWQASGRAIRDRIDEERRMQAQLARDRSKCDEEERGHAAYQRLLARKSAHDAVCEAKHADEFLVAEFEEWKRALDEGESGYATARKHAAKRATSQRREKRREEKNTQKRLLQLIASRVSEAQVAAEQAAAEKKRAAEEEAARRKAEAEEAKRVYEEKKTAATELLATKEAAIGEIETYYRQSGKGGLMCAEAQNALRKAKDEIEEAKKGMEPYRVEEAKKGKARSRWGKLGIVVKG